MEVGDPIAIHNRGMYYSEGLYGQPQNYTKALELWHRSAKLEHAASYSNIGYSYDGGEGVKVDKKRRLGIITSWQLVGEMCMHGIILA